MKPCSYDAVMLLGPTASGKTALALEIAQRIPSEIISIDSALVYKHMDIGTAKPTKEELTLVPHHLIDIIEPTDSYSAADFVKDCEEKIEEIHSRGKLPLIVGGTMLYAKALLQGMDNLPTSTPEVREKINSMLQEEGVNALHKRLGMIDPLTAEKLSPNDTQRISRALEVYELSGKPISSFYGASKGTSFNIKACALFPDDRKVLHEQIEKRFDQMLENGFVDEVKALMKIPRLTKEHSSMRCVGYRQAWEYIEGISTFESFREKGIAATRQLAKRQITWLRSFEGVERLSPDMDLARKKFLELCGANNVSKEVTD